MTLLMVLVGIAVVAGTALLLIRDRPLLAPEPDPSGPPPGQLPGQAASLTDITFPIVLRGYRMDQVDLALDGVQQELQRKDERIAALEDTSAALRALLQQEGANRTGVDEG